MTVTYMVDVRRVVHVVVADRPLCGREWRRLPPSWRECSADQCGHHGPVCGGCMRQIRAGTDALEGLDSASADALMATLEYEKARRWATAMMRERVELLTEQRYADLVEARR